MALMCTSYCSHGGRCELDPGHDGLHDSNYCTWTDTEGLTKAAADAVLATKDGGQDYLDTMDPVAEFIESMYDGMGDGDV
jgi:hypothetical protein